MEVYRTALAFIGASAVLGLAGCARAPATGSSARLEASRPVWAQPEAPAATRPGQPIQQTTHYQAAIPPLATPAENGQLFLDAVPVPAETPVAPTTAVANPLQRELSLEQLIVDVQSRNPSLHAAVEAWRAAAERYPQVVSLDDPMFGYMKGLNMGYMVEASQKVPWPGKRALRGEAADAEANAACHEIQDVKLQLARAASMAYFDYYQAVRELEVNAESERLLTAFKEIAATQYEAAKATQQDVLQAEVERVTLRTRTAALQRGKAIAVARINTLLHQSPDCPLPPPPEKLPLPAELPPVDVLRRIAVQHRPDLAAQAARIQAEAANVGLAYKEYYPDMEFVYRHDEFMPESSMYNQLGVNVNVPLYQAKRHAAVRESHARACRQRAEYQSRIDEVAFEVQSAAHRVSEAREVLKLYEANILPTVRASIDSARENYVAGRLDFLRLIEAQRQLRDQQERYYQVQAELHRQMAELERAVGSTLH
jgi:outer membrane protein TolC